jgi:NMD protein affecting ribosome stability and mRNA decay
VRGRVRHHQCPGINAPPREQRQFVARSSVVAADAHRCWDVDQCRICQRAESKDTWQAVVQLRQKVPHRRTFLYLEQLILTHKADKEALNIKEVKDGMDFFFASKQAGAKFSAFLASVVPTATKESGRVVGISHHVRFIGRVNSLAACFRLPLVSG